MSRLGLTAVLCVYVLLIITANNALPGMGKMFIGVLLLIGVAFWLMAVREREPS